MYHKIKQVIFVAKFLHLHFESMCFTGYLPKALEQNMCFIITKHAIFSIWVELLLTVPESSLEKDKKVESLSKSWWKRSNLFLGGFRTKDRITLEQMLLFF